MNCKQRGKITLNVGGQLFTTTIDTLVLNSAYFSGLFKFNSSQEEPLFIDRSPRAFAEILEYIRSPETYHVPKKYENELIFYGIPYDESNLEDNIDDIMAKHTKIVLDKMNDTMARDTKIVLDKMDELKREITYIKKFVCGECVMSKCIYKRDEKCLSHYCSNHCRHNCFAKICKYL